MSVCTGSLEMFAPPTGRLISLSEARKHCRVDADMTDDDSTLYDLIDAATAFVEQEIWGHRQLLTATYDLPVEYFWTDELKLPRPPLAVLDRIQYRAQSTGTLTTLSSSVYLVRKPWRMPGTVELAPDQEWPNVDDDYRHPVIVRFTAGYATPFTAVAGTDIITATGRTFTDGDSFQLSKTDDSTLPGGLSLNTTYYARDSSGATCKLATTSGGAAIDITDAGTGTFFVGVVPRTLKRAVLLVIGHWYAQRTPVAIGTISKELEVTLTSLCQSEGYGSYI